HGDDLALAVLVAAAQGGAGVAAEILAPRLEAGVALSRVGGELRVDVVQIADHFVDGTVQAVQVEAEEAGSLTFRQAFVVAVQPAQEVEYGAVGPHPSGEAGEGTLATPCLAAAQVVVDVAGVRPVRLHRDEVEAVVGDQFAADVGTHLVEFTAAMAGFAEQDEAGVANAPQEGAEVGAVDAAEGFGGGA